MSPDPTPNASDPNDFPIVIIGAGFAGLGTAIQLKKAGIHSFTVFERADEVGGTWRDNTYPGAACDVPSHVYSFSFEMNPNWTRSFSESAEIQSYLIHCADKYGVRSHIRFGTEIVEAAFDAEAGVWRLATDGGETVTARVVISGVGGLVDPAYPDIPGIEDFAGELFHTARWNHDADLAGKDVAVIGTGASAVQVVPAIAPEVGSLSVFQRTAAWVMPKHDAAFSEKTKQRFRRFPFLQRAFRWLLYGLSEMMGPLVISNSKRLSAIGEKASSAHLEASVKDPELRERLRPDFQFGCKRILISNDYWPAFERENVELVTEGIERIHEHGIRTKDGKDHPADAIVLATGFALGLAAAPFKVTGLEGRTLDDVWARGAVAYKGMTVAGFPNWFILMGPNTGPGHTSVLIYTEAQIGYALQAIERMRTGNVKYFDVKPSVQAAYNEKIQARMPHTSWASGCNSWYLAEDGGNHALYPGLAAEYVLRARRFRPSEYQRVDFQPRDRQPTGNS